MRGLILILFAAVALGGCTATAALQQGLPAGEAAVQTISTAPLATCVGVVQQSNALLQSLKSSQPALLPTP